MLNKKPKPSFANSPLIKNLQDSNKKLNLIDGESENLENNFQEVQLETVKPNNQEEVATNIILNASGEPSKTQEVAEGQTTISKKRNNVPVHEEQYWLLNAISKVTGISITQLVKEGLAMTIAKYQEDFDEEIKSIQAIQKKMRIAKEGKN